MSHKHGYYLRVSDVETSGIGECSYIEGLSIDDLHGYGAKLKEVCSEIESIAAIFYQTGKLPGELIARFPSMAFGVEMALLDLQHGGRKQFFELSDFYSGKQAIPINGLVWMGSEQYMQEQIQQKLEAGFRCIKIKVAAIDFKEECRLIEGIRKQFAPEVIEIRLDANGGFSAAEVRDKLHTLAQYSIHSIEQPVKPEQYLLMRELCQEAIMPIALDEELIGVSDVAMKGKLLDIIQPPYIILKPSLLGGMAACDEWITLAEERQIKWWATSALESNIGLNAIAQWAASKGTDMLQGLGTGGLYTNNIASPLFIQNGKLHYNPSEKWGM
jgi:o-succinylbenzoate synthase